MTKLSLILIITLFSFSINFYYGHQGLMPLDDLQNFNSGFRILKGDFPFKDYYSITGPFLDIWQSYIYKIFGISWQSFVLHASLMNCLYSISIFIFLQKLNFSLITSFLFSISGGLLMYPTAGNPTVEHSSLILSVIATFLFIIGSKENKNYLFFFSIFIFGISFFVKQVPTLYFVFFCIILFFSQTFNIVNHKKIFFISLYTACVSLLLISYFHFNGVSFSEVVNQYYFIAKNLGELRFQSLNLHNFYENTSKLFFLLFLLVPSLYISFITKNKSGFLVLAFLSLIIVFYEIHTNNQPITFALLPIFIAFFQYFYNGKFQNSNFVKIYLLIIIIYAFYRILRFEIFYIIGFFFFITAYFVNTRKVVSYFLIVYLFISSLLYFEKYVKIRSWDDLSKDDLLISFDGNIIDKKLSHLKWRTVYFDNIEIEKELIKNTLGYLRTLNNNTNYILFSDYQIYNIILNRRDYSPVKYWYKDATYPSKKSIYRNEFESFFKNKIIDNNVKFFVVDNTSNFKSAELQEFTWLYKCLEKKNLNFDKDLFDVFEVKLNCINSVK